MRGDMKAVKLAYYDVYTLMKDGQTTFYCECKKGTFRFNSPYGDIGERLWVMERHKVIFPLRLFQKDGRDSASTPKNVLYEVGGSSNGHWDSTIDEYVTDFTWTTAGSMPKWASRFIVEIAGIHMAAHDFKPDVITFLIDLKLVERKDQPQGESHATVIAASMSAD